MNYFVLRDEQQYGPYSLADLQRYIASGNILTTDMARGEATQDWVQVQQILAAADLNDGAPVPPSYGQVPSFVAPGQPPARVGPELVPDLHWGLVLLFAIVTLGLFTSVWMFLQAAAAKRLDPKSNALLFFIVGVALEYGGPGVLFTLGHHHHGGLNGLLNLAGAIVIIVGQFNIKDSLEDYFNRMERVGLRLSTLMTFVFGTIYFQYHFNRINRWRRTGVLS